jgi:hypothetical protein
MARLPGARSAGIDPRVILRRMLWPDNAHLAASSATVKNSVIRFSASVNQAAAS